MLPDFGAQADSLPMLSITRDGVILWHSRHVDEILRVKKREELDVYNMLAALRLRDRSVLTAHLEQVIDEQRPARCELELVLPNSSRQWIRLISHPGAEGSNTCWSSVENLTQIKRMEKNEAFYQRAAEIAGKAESLRDFSQRIFDLLRILFGIENGCVAVKNLYTGNVDFPFAVDQKAPMPQSRSPENGMVDYVLTMGRMVWLNDAQANDKQSDLGFELPTVPPADWIGVPVSHRQQVVGMVAVYTYDPNQLFSTKDIGLMLGIGNLFEVFLERMELQETQARLSAAIEQAGETVVITDAHGVILYANPALEKVTGYRIDEVLGKTPALFQSGKHSPAFYEEMWVTLGSGHSWRGSFINRRKDGSLYEEEAVISPVRNHEGKAVNYVAVKRDISRETKLQRQYLEVQKMEAVNKLTSGIAKDFSNLLMVVRQNAEYLLDGAKREPAVPQTELNEIVKATGVGELLLKQLNALASDADVAVEITDINDLINSFEPVARRLVGGRTEVHLDLATRMLPVSVREGQLAQALSNLMINAAHAMPDGGTVTIRTGASTLKEKERGNFVEPPPHDGKIFAFVEIQDEGAGVDIEKLPELFSLNVDLDAEKPAGGLGLSSTLEIVRRHNGYISVHNHSPQGGAVYTLHFPLEEETEKPTPQQQMMAEPTLARGNETILLAEDEEGARRVIARMLQDQGYTVIEAENGAMAIRSMLFHQGEIDLLLTDLVMPDFDGRALAEQIKSLKPDIRVLYTSGYQPEDLEESGIEFPAGSLLKKPFRREELISLVQKALAPL